MDTSIIERQSENIVNEIFKIKTTFYSKLEREQLKHIFQKTFRCKNMDKLRSNLANEREEENFLNYLSEFNFAKRLVDNNIDFQYENESEIDFAIQSNGKKFLVEIKNLHPSKITKKREELCRNLLDKAQKTGKSQKSPPNLGEHFNTNWGAKIDENSTIIACPSEDGISRHLSWETKGQEWEELDYKTKILDYISEFEEKLKGKVYELSTLVFVSHWHAIAECFFRDIFYWYFTDKDPPPFVFSGVPDLWLKKKGIQKLRNINSLLFLRRPDNVIWDWEKSLKGYYQDTKANEIKDLISSILHMNISFNK